jgi:hypothetical protein
MGALRKCLIFILSSISITISCRKHNDIVKPSVTTLPVTSITTSGGIAGGNITSDGNSAITRSGLLWDTTPTFRSGRQFAGTATSGKFTFPLSGLNSATTWYVTAYASNIAGTAYGDTVRFTTDTVPSDYTVITVAGNGIPAITNGPAFSASFNVAFSVATARGGVLYVSDASGIIPWQASTGYIRRIAADGMVSTLATLGISPMAIVTDRPGNIYDLDVNDTLYKITPAGVVNPLAATFSNPISMDIDSKGNLFATFEKFIAVITPTGLVTKLPFKSFNGFWAIAVNRADNSIYVMDGPVMNRIDTLGNLTALFGGSIQALSTLRVDRNGNLIGTTNGSHLVISITPSGTISTIAGNGTAGNVDGGASRANFDYPTGLSIDSSGIIFVSDDQNRNVKKITHK